MLLFFRNVQSIGSMQMRTGNYKTNKPVAKFGIWANWQDKRARKNGHESYNL